MRKIFRRLWFYIPLGVILVLLAGVAFSLFQRGDLAPSSVQLDHLENVGNVLQAYAGEHDGNFPARLSDLSLESLTPSTRRYLDPQTKVVATWLYFPGHTMSDPPEILIAASPKPMFQDRRIVVEISTSTYFLAEKEFLSRVAAQFAVP